MSAIPSEEEPWEREIGALLGRLPPVDPPAGFIDSALDHRPLHAGRILVGLLALSVVALLASVATDAAGRTRVAPQIDQLAQRHDNLVRAGVIGSLSVEAEDPVETGVDMPEGFERTYDLEAEDIRQALYARDDQAVSVFVQSGRVRWDSLPPGGMTEIDGVTAWVDEERRVTVVEASNRMVTIVGLSGDQVGQVLDTVPRSDPTLLERAHRTVNAITDQLGYPDLG